MPRPSVALRPFCPFCPFCRLCWFRQCLGALLGRLRTGHRVGIYIEWVLLREPHHLPRQPTRSTLDSSAPGTSIYTSRAPNRPGLWRPPGRGFGALDLGTRDSTPANRTAPSSTPAKGARGGAQDPRVRRGHLPPPPPPRRVPSLRGASHLSIFRCQLANAPGLLGPPPGALEPLPPR